MPEVYIPLEDAAVLECVGYETMKKRIQRSPQQYQIQQQPRESGGKDQIMVAVTSLSAKARRAYRAAEKTVGRDAVIEQRTETRPWYVSADYNEYVESHKRAFYEAVELAARVQDFIEYSGPDKTGYADRYALELGVSAPTLYRYVGNVLEANAWALCLEREDGQNRDYFRALSLCRKPRDKETFPSLSEEQKAVIQSIWFHADFANNDGTIELLYDAFEAEAERRGWSAYPSVKTVGRYVHYLMELPPAQSARFLAANGTREWKNKMQVKGKRDATTLEVMEYVVADAHTFDFWIQITLPNGKLKAIRPTLVAWEDIRSRRVLGCILCEHSDTQIVKESFIKMCWQAGCIPKYAHTDNGKDFANRETLGQDRNIRAMDAALMDSEVKGFYLAMGSKGWSRSLPFQPWDKPIERVFGTFCKRFSRRFASYTGTLTGSKTAGKRRKDVASMLERGELLTAEECLEEMERYLAEDYDKREHDGLKKSGDRWVTPASVWENAEHYNKALPPREYAAMLLMKPDRAKVQQQGITKFSTLYTADELAHYIGKWVNIRWDVGDVSRLYVYDLKGKKICEATAAELLEFGDRVSQDALEALHRRKNKQLSEVREFLKEAQKPAALCAEDGTPAAVGKFDLMIGHAPKPKVIALPIDKEYRAEITSRKKQSGAGDEFLAAKADNALERLRAIND